MSKDLKVFICRNITLEPLVPTLQKAAAGEGWNLIAELSGYGDFEAQVLNPASDLARFGPDLIWVWLELAELHETFWYQFAAMRPEQAREAEEAISSRLETFLLQIQEKYPVPVVVQNFARPPWPTLGLAGNHLEWGQWNAMGRINERLAALCARETHLYLFDFDRFCARAGLEKRIDPKHWYLSNLALAASLFRPYADEWLRTIRAVRGKRRKCLVLDLDNTLWGGVVGEEGLSGLQLGGSYPGNAFKDFQKAILNLYHQGIILLLCSKNNEADAWEVFDHHPEMVLRRDHIAAFRINWIDKATNIRELAEELNLGLDSFVFLDDKPEEREWVRTQIPEVLVPDFPKEPFRLPGFLQSLDAFETYSLSEEDRKRTEYYHRQAKRAETRRSAGSLEDYLRSLELKIEIGTVDPASIGRVAQLTQKTNQFNVMTRRFTEAEVADFRDRGGRVYWGRVSDRFGDSGIVIIAMVSIDGDEARIENFLMSCRVIGLTVEQSFLGWLTERLGRDSIRRVVGEFCPTQKNALAADFYDRMGFTRMEELSEGASRWELDLPGGPSIPDWIDLQTPDRAPSSP